MQHLEGSGTPDLYIGRTVLKGSEQPDAYMVRTSIETMYSGVCYNEQMLQGTNSTTNSIYQ